MPLDAASDLSDDALMVLFANGDPLAAQSLTARLLPRTLAITRRLLPNSAEAEDAAQEAMIKLWKVAPNWRQGEAKVSTWLHRVTVNHCWDVLRKKRPLPLADDFDAPDDRPSAEAQMIAADRRSALSAALDKLPDRQRVAIHLRHFDECSNPEIAEILETSVEAVESLLSRGRRALAALLLDQKEALGLS